MSKTLWYNVCECVFRGGVHLSKGREKCITVCLEVTVHFGKGVDADTKVGGGRHTC